MEPSTPGTELQSAGKSNLPSMLVVVFLAALTLAVLFRSPYDAGNLSTVPDGAEYAVGAWRFATQGVYNIVLLGKVFPDRYPPGFPILVLSPVYHFLPGDLGNGIFGVLALGLVGVISAWYIGKQFGGIWSAAFSVLALLLSADYRLGITRILSDGATAVLGIAACLVYLRIRAHEHTSTRAHEHTSTRAHEHTSTRAHGYGTSTTSSLAYFPASPLLCAMT